MKLPTTIKKQFFESVGFPGPFSDQEMRLESVAEKLLCLFEYSRAWRLGRLIKGGIMSSLVLCSRLDKEHCLTASLVQLPLHALAHIFCLSGSSQ